jgi:hypothetical protein
VADPSRSQFLRIGRKPQIRIDLSGGQQPLRFHGGVENPVHVLPRVQADVRQHARQERVLARVEIEHGYRLALQIADGPDPVRSEQLKAPDVSTGENDDRIAGLQPQH